MDKPLKHSASFHNQWIPGRQQAVGGYASTSVMLSLPWCQSCAQSGTTSKGLLGTPFKNPWSACRNKCRNGGGSVSSVAQAFDVFYVGTSK